MATKNIKRSAMEAGQGSDYKFMRLERNRRLRHKTRQSLHVMQTQEDFYEDCLLPVLSKSEKECISMRPSGPLVRWLIARSIGKTRDEIEGMIFRLFDTRNRVERALVYRRLMFNLNCTEIAVLRGQERWMTYKRQDHPFVNGRLTRPE